jgi:hypothetical protein
MRTRTDPITRATPIPVHQELWPDLLIDVHKLKTFLASKSK